MRKSFKQAVRDMGVFHLIYVLLWATQWGVFLLLPAHWATLLLTPVCWLATVFGVIYIHNRFHHH